MREKCLAQEHNRLYLRAGLEARSLDPETRTLNTRLPSLHEGSILLYKTGVVSQAVFLIGKIGPITSELKISNFVGLKESALTRKLLWFASNIKKGIISFILRDYLLYYNDEDLTKFLLGISLILFV